MTQTTRGRVPLLRVERLCRYFRLPGGRTLKAVDDVSFEVFRGETLGLVGESGCGKSTLGRTVLGLHPATSGSVLFDGLDVHAARGADRLRFKKRAQIVLQNPYASLNPRMTVGDIVAEGLDAHRLCRDKEDRLSVRLPFADAHGPSVPHFGEPSGSRSLTLTGRQSQPLRGSPPCRGAFVAL